MYAQEIYDSEMFPSSKYINNLDEIYRLPSDLEFLNQKPKMNFEVESVVPSGRGVCWRHPGVSFILPTEISVKLAPVYEGLEAGLSSAPALLAAVTALTGSASLPEEAYQPHRKP